MSNLISVDPGLNHAGIAYFEDGVLKCAWTINPKKQTKDAAGWSTIAGLVEEAVCDWGEFHLYQLAYEMPQFIDGWSNKVDVNAVLQVAGAAGAIVQALSQFTESGTSPIAVRPSEWTKGRPKKANHLRMWGRLSVDEIVQLSDTLKIDPNVLYSCIKHGDEADLEHALDAVCIGLKVLDRFERER